MILKCPVVGKQRDGIGPWMNECWQPSRKKKVKIKLWFWSLLCMGTLTYFEQSLLSKQQRQQAGQAKRSCRKNSFLVPSELQGLNTRRKIQLKIQLPSKSLKLFERTLWWKWRYLTFWYFPICLGKRKRLTLITVTGQKLMCFMCVGILVLATVKISPRLFAGPHIPVCLYNEVSKIITYSNVYSQLRMALLTFPSPSEYYWHFLTIGRDK